MYRVTLRTKPNEGVEISVANQDLGRVLALACRIQSLNPSFEVSYVPVQQ